MCEVKPQSRNSIAHPELVEGLLFLARSEGRRKGDPSTSSGRAGWGYRFSLAALLLATLPIPAFAQGMDPDMPGMGHSGHDMAEMNQSGCRTVGMDHPPGDEDGMVMISTVVCEPGQGSGTSRLPANEGGHHGVHINPGGGWALMLHGYVTAVTSKQTGPRGDDKSYAQSMVMLSAEHDLGDKAHLQLRTMFSLEPLMKHSGYPNLFATGETAQGLPLVDRQHPHDLFMELAAKVDVNVGASGTKLFLYGGPVGEPALGPSAFMHRRSAKYNPEAPITHHWFDSTHISYGVVTAGLSTRKFQLEASAFRGREPDERRWNIETPKLDSWSVRGTWNPSPRWALQLSHGRLKEPEELEPGINEKRTIASVHYATPNFSLTAAFSNKNRSEGPTLTAYAAEANWDIDDHHTIFGRFENVRNNELFPDPVDPLHGLPFRVSKFQAGYAYRIPLTGPLNLAIGGSISAFAKPAALDTAYGKRPMGYTLFARFALGH